MVPLASFARYSTGMMLRAALCGLATFGLLAAGCSGESSESVGPTTITTGGHHSGGGGAGANGNSGGTGASGNSGGTGAMGGTVSCDGMLVETIANATVVPSPAGGEPAAGSPFLIPETHVSYRRISDVGDPGASGTDYTNGYSRWSPANITGQYATAFGSDGQSAVYRLADRTIVRSLPVGEANELHWDATGASGTETMLYYRVDAELRRMDVLVGNEELVHDFTVEYPTAGAVLNGVEGAPSRDMRYWAFQVCDSMDGGGQCLGIQDIIVYDLQSDAVLSRLSDTHPGMPTPNFVDISPSGSRIVVGTCKDSGSTPAPWDGPYAWSLDFSTNVRLDTNCSHSGWAWGSAGQEYSVAYDTCGANNEEATPTCDFLIAVDVNDPQGWDNRLGIAYWGDIGWDYSNHMGRIYDSNVRGWFFMSTYGELTTGWPAHQLLFVELVPQASGPRLLRVGPTVVGYSDYWTEAFASLDFQAEHVYWGSNWDGAANLELYQATLCSGWWNAIQP